MKNIIFYGKSLGKQNSKKGRIYKKTTGKNQEPAPRAWDLAARLEYRRTGNKKNQNSRRSSRG